VTYSTPKEDNRTDNVLPAPENWRKKMTFWFGAIICVVLTGWALRAMSAVLIPLAFALFISLMLAPLVKRVAEAVPPKLSWLGVVAAMGLLFLILLVFLAGVSFAIQQLSVEIPRVGDRLRSFLPDGGAGLSDTSASEPLLQQISGILRDTGGAFGGWIIDYASVFAQQAASIISAVVASVVIVFFLVLIILSEKDQWSAKIAALSSNTAQQVWLDGVTVAMHRLRKFLVVRALIGLVTAALYAGWLALFGIDLLIVWALLTFLLTFIPSLGSIISGFLPVLYALLVVDPQTVFWIGTGLFIIEQVIGNYIDPKLQGREILVSPLVILIALLVWGWIWGAAGTLLSTPIMILLLITLHHNGATRPAALLLSNQTDLADLDAALAS